MNDIKTFDRFAAVALGALMRGCNWSMGGKPIKSAEDFAEAACSIANEMMAVRQRLIAANSTRPSASPEGAPASGTEG